MSFQDKAHGIFQISSPYLIFSVGYLLATFIPVLLLDRDTMVRLTLEDNYFELVGAVFWLIASVLFFILFMKHRVSNDLYLVRTNRNVFFFLLGCLFFLGFGEEISWGQHILGFQTPELLNEINRQHEVNIHNLSIFHGNDAEGQRKGFLALMLNIDRLFSVFWFTYCLLVPIAHRMSSGVAGFLSRIGLPIVPISIGSLFMLNYLISKILEWTLRTGRPVVEIKEHNFAFLFVILAIWFVMNYKADLGPANSEKIANA